MKYGYLFFTAAQQALQERLMPFEFEILNAEKIVTLFHYDFINYYSKLRKTPVFTAERLNGMLLKVNQQYIYV